MLNHGFVKPERSMRRPGRIPSVFERDIGGSNPSEKEFFRTRSDRPRVPPSLLQTGSGSLYLG